MKGKKILHYQILEELGRGGMGIVYKAEDTRLNRIVALKMLPPHLLVSADDRARFTREAKAAASLHHANIATVFEINEYEHTPFIVMEHVEGQTLNHHIEKGPMKLAEALQIAIQVAGGLKAAHAKGIVHRDIKSSNIIIGPEKQAKILDFGLAKTSMSTKLTQMGSTVGTVAYMSPEQVNGEEVDQRSDLWSLGVVLYEMIAGRLPFAGDYDRAIFYAIQNEEPEPLTAIRTGVPMSLEWMVSKLMAKSPSERYQTAADLIIDLNAVNLEDSGFSRIKQSSKPSANIKPLLADDKIRFSYKNILLLTSFLLLFVVSAVLLIINFYSGPDEDLYFNISALEGEKEQILRSDQQVIAISPDGRTIAYFVVEGLNTTLYLKSLKDFKVRKFEGLGNVSGEPSFSPDGNWLAFNADGQLKRVSVITGTVDVIYQKQAYRGLAWQGVNTVVYTPAYGAGWRTVCHDTEYRCPGTVECL